MFFEPLDNSKYRSIPPSLKSLSYFESDKQGANKMEFPARPLDKLESLQASLKAFLSSIT